MLAEGPYINTSFATSVQDAEESDTDFQPMASEEFAANTMQTYIHVYRPSASTKYEFNL